MFEKLIMAIVLVLPFMVTRVTAGGVPQATRIRVFAGTQGRSASAGGTASWWGMTIFAKYHATPTVSVVGRFEQYSDPNQVIVVTKLPASFRTIGGSLGVDVNLQTLVLWRSELRGFRSQEPVWPLNTVGQSSRDNVFFVSSLAITF